MVRGPLFLAPVFQERIWGGTALRDRFGYEIPSEHTGECWGISAHPNGQCHILNGSLAGQTLGEVWSQHPELFGRVNREESEEVRSQEEGLNEGSESPEGLKSEVVSDQGICTAKQARVDTDVPFPLLVKILDANADLSVQVHPADAYAAQHEKGELGKSECWYVLDCAPDAELILGHTATSRAELAERMQRGEWDDLLVRRKIRPGQFFYVPSGTVHALGKDTLVLEVQQSSDTTYRVYDYDRVDTQGNKRELHLEKALDVITVPHVDASVARQVVDEGVGYCMSCLVEAEFFAAYHLEVQAGGTYVGGPAGGYLLASVIAGEGVFATATGEWVLQRGDHFIIPATVTQFEVKGSVEIILVSRTKRAWS